MISENEKFKRYLLSSLAEDEMEKVDLQIISDANLEAVLQRAESELMEDYLEKNLTAEETRKFENDFLVNDERRKDLEFLRLMKTRASAKPDEIPAAAETETWSFAKMAGRLFPIPAFVAALFIVLGIFGFYFLIKSREAQQRNYIVQLNHRDLSNLEELKYLSSLSLAEGSFRDSNATARLSGDKLSEEVLIRLALPPDIQVKSVFEVNLLQNNMNVLTLKDISSYSNQAGQEMRLIFPREEMKKGSYQIELRKGADPPLVYSFTVE